MLRSNSNRETGQLSVSPQSRMPVDDGITSNTQSVTGDTCQLYYYTAAGVETIDAGQAAGTATVGNLTNKNILNGLGFTVGEYGDTSFAWVTGTIFTRLVPFRGLLVEEVEGNGETKTLTGQERLNAVTAGFRNGDYCIDHEHGVIYGVKATTGVSDTCNYKVLVSGGGGSVAENVNLTKVGGNTVTTGAGAVSSGTLRMTHASDDPVTTALQIIDDWDESDRAKVNPIVGQAGVAGGAGASSATTQRVTEGSTSMLARGTEDVAGADTYTTLITPATACTHLAYSLQGDYDAILSLDNGVTEHMVLPARSSAVLDALTISASVNIQAKNKTSGSNYANLNVSVW